MAVAIAGHGLANLPFPGVQVTLLGSLRERVHLLALAAARALRLRLQGRRRDRLDAPQRLTVMDMLKRSYVLLNVMVRQKISTCSSIGPHVVVHSQLAMDLFFAAPQALPHPGLRNHSLLRSLDEGPCQQVVGLVNELGVLGLYWMVSLNLLGFHR